MPRKRASDVTLAESDPRCTKCSKIEKSLERQSRVWDREKAKMNEKLEQLQQVNFEMESRATQLQQKLEDGMDESITLGRNQELQTKFENVIAHLYDSEMRLEDLEKQCATLQEENMKLSTQLLHTEQERNDLSSCVSEFQDEMVALNARLSKTKEENTDLSTQLLHSEQERVALCTRLSETKEENERGNSSENVDSEISQLQDQINSLIQERDHANTQWKKIMNDLWKRSRTVEELRASCASLVAERDQLVQHLRALEHELSMKKSQMMYHHEKRI